MSETTVSAKSRIVEIAIPAVVSVGVSVVGLIMYHKYLDGLQDSFTLTMTEMADNHTELLTNTMHAVIDRLPQQ